MASDADLQRLEARISALEGNVAGTAEDDMHITSDEIRAYRKVRDFLHRESFPVLANVAGVPPSPGYAAGYCAMYCARTAASISPLMATDPSVIGTGRQMPYCAFAQMPYCAMAQPPDQNATDIPGSDTPEGEGGGGTARFGSLGH